MFIISFTIGSRKQHQCYLKQCTSCLCIVHNLFLPVDIQNNLFEVFEFSPNGSNFNGSLWTLPLEIRAYFICFFLVLLGKKFGLLRIFIAFQMYLIICIIGDTFNNRFIYYVYPDFIHFSSKFMFAFFFSGMIAIIFRNRVIKIDYLYGAFILFIIFVIFIIFITFKIFSFFIFQYLIT